MLDELFENKYVAKTIDHFISHEKIDQNQQELCDKVGTYPKVMKQILEKLLKFGIIEETRKIAKSKLYKINNNSILLKILKQLREELAKTKNN